jgi:hypothetical protein
MYMLGGGQDVRCARLRQRLGVTVGPVSKSAAIGRDLHCVSASSTSQGVSVGASPQATSDSSSAQQPSEVDAVDDACEPAEVCCALHPSVCGQHNVFASVHDAVMAVCMLEWLVADMPAAADASTGVQSPTDTDCKACKMLQSLPNAAAQLQQYLDRASDVFDSVLPVWRQLDALVPPEEGG